MEERNYMADKEKLGRKIEQQNKKIFELVVNICVSLIVTILVNILIAKRLGLW